MSYETYCEELGERWNSHQAWMISLRAWVEERCFYCGSHLLWKRTTAGVRHRYAVRTRDHIVPKSQGGRVTVSCCSQCNTGKTDMSLEEFRLLVFQGEREPFFGEAQIGAPLDTLTTSKVSAKAKNLQEIRLRVQKNRGNK